MRLPFFSGRARRGAGLLRALLLTGMGLMIPCYLFTVGNVALSPWPLYERNRLALALLTPACLLALLLLLRTADRHEAFFARHERRVLLGFALFYLVVQLVMATQLRFIPVTDAEQCFTAAELLTDTGTYGNVERPFIYFTRYPHNLGLVYLLSFVFRIGNALGLADRFMQAVVACSVLFTLGLLSAARLCRRLCGVRGQTRLLLLLLTCLPLLYCTSELYTDAFSLAFPTMIVYAFVRTRGAGTRGARALWAVLFALSAFIGAQIRFTSVIAAIACLIAALFESRVRLTAWLAAPLALVFVAGSAAVNAENARHLGAENIEKYTLPKLHYIAMGLPVQSDEGYGQYGYGGWLVFSTSFDDPQERDAALLREVIDRIYYLRYPSRLLNMMSRKNLSTFGDGTFRLNEIIEGDVRDADNLVKQFVFAPGKYYPLYYHLCTAMFLAQMLLACLACAQAIKRRQTHAAALFVALLGIFLFLCMWETRARYFFQFELVLLCAGAMLETPCRGAVHLHLPMRRKACVPGDACDGSSAQRP